VRWFWAKDAASGNYRWRHCEIFLVKIAKLATVSDTTRDRFNSFATAIGLVS
jgi:hypothetical protein